MFDAKTVCTIRLVCSPVACCQALRELKERIKSRDVGPDDTVVVQTHQSLPKDGGSDAKLSEVTSSRPAAVVPPSEHSTPLAKPAAGGSRSNACAARMPATRRRVRKNPAAKRGGAP